MDSRRRYGILCAIDIIIFIAHIVFGCIIDLLRCKFGSTSVLLRPSTFVWCIINHEGFFLRK